MTLTKKELIQRLKDGEKLTYDDGNTYCYYDENGHSPFKWTDGKSTTIMYFSWKETEWEIYKEPYKPWVPKKGEAVWHINADGELYEVNFFHYYAKAFSQGNIYRTKAGAEQEVKWREAKHALEQEIDRLNEGWTPDWKGPRSNYFVFIDINNNLLSTNNQAEYKYHQDWFYLKSDILALELIKTHLKELKIYLQRMPYGTNRERTL